MIYFASDLHFDHTNIIAYCSRPFKSVMQMNETLVENWNRVVKPNDTVFFLGDYSFGKGSKSAHYWMKQLNGNIVNIKGSHDKGLKARNRQVLNYGYMKLLLIHNPEDAPKNWDGWIIHGHKHNNSDEHPFIEGNNKTINVSVEMIGYKPLSLDKLASLDINSIARMETVNSKPIRKIEARQVRYMPKQLYNRKGKATSELQLGYAR